MTEYQRKGRVRALKLVPDIAEQDLKSFLGEKFIAVRNGRLIYFSKPSVVENNDYIKDVHIDGSRYLVLWPYNPDFVDVYYDDDFERQYEPVEEV